MDFQHKTALVTGGATRIGKSLCMGLAEHGFKVAIHYHNSAQQAEQLADEIIKKGGQAFPLQADLTDNTQIRALLSNTTEHIGPVDLLINNASLFKEDSMQTLDEDLWEKHFKIHVQAPAFLTHEFAKQGISKGLVVNMIDQRVLKSTPQFMSYSLSKSTLWAATKSMAQALAPHIRVNAIGPGPTLPSARQLQADFDKQVSSLLLQRGPSLEEIVQTVLYFAQTPSVTGQIIALDGGQHLAWETADQRITE